MTLYTFLKDAVIMDIKVLLQFTGKAFKVYTKNIFEYNLKTFTQTESVKFLKYREQSSVEFLFLSFTHVFYLNKIRIQFKNEQKQ